MRNKYQVKSTRGNTGERQYYVEDSRGEMCVPLDSVGFECSAYFNNKTAAEEFASQLNEEDTSWCTDYKIGDCVIAEDYHYVWEIIGFHGHLVALISSTKNQNFSKTKIVVPINGITLYKSE